LLTDKEIVEKENRKNLSEWVTISPNMKIAQRKINE
jgi:hypothetical protein